MAAVVVQAHPLDESYSTALLEAVVAGLRTAGVDPRVVRLHRGDVLDGATVESASDLVFVYPTWWGAMPAMLLGPLTDLLERWVDGDAPRSTSPLRNVARLTIVTTHGGSRTINRLQGEPARHFWKRTVMPLCAPGGVHASLVLYDVVNAEQHELAAFVDRVRTELSASA